ncbi:hypothetical protein LWI28_017405 [Acer negundo]|uniref:Uncharacterized protein n=1 Tax=Acer negundo TaxID=4023 RepID=A0AAD5IES4_ACENE|nr:hypothetical protein LWI28_017405 [Acer negundo]
MWVFLPSNLSTKPFLQQLSAQFPSVGGSNTVLGSIPTTDPSFDQTVNPIIPEDQTIDEVVTEPYNEDDRSIPEYNPHSEYGLDDFNEDYIGRSGSREGVNDEPTPYHGMGSNPTYGGGCTGQNCRNPSADQQINVPDPQIVPPPPPQRRKCKSCKQEGHNIRTSPTRPYDNLTDPDNDVE